MSVITACDQCGASQPPLFDPKRETWWGLHGMVNDKYVVIDLCSLKCLQAWLELYG
jgi:hypothetical protein